MGSSPETTAQTDVDDIHALVAAEREPMVRLACLLIGSRAEAEEVVQESFAVVAQRWEEIDRPGGYLRTTVVNGCRSVLRRREVAERHARHDRPRDDVALPTHLVELAEALDRLTERQRTVIVLRYFVDLPDDEIAAVIDARPATVRSLAHRALHVLREELS